MQQFTLPGKLGSQRDALVCLFEFLTLTDSLVDVLYRTKQADRLAIVRVYLSDQPYPETLAIGTAEAQFSVPTRRRADSLPDRFLNDTLGLGLEESADFFE